MTDYVSGISPYMGSSLLYNDYANRVFLNDAYTYGSTAGMMGMDGSLFSGTTTMPFMPTFTGGGMNYQSYFENMQQYQDFMYDSQIRQAQKRRQVSFVQAAPERAIDDQLEILHEKILKNEQQQVIPALNAVLESVAACYGNNANPEDLIAMAKSAYRQKYNTSISEDLRKYGNGSITQGFLQTATFGLADKRTAEENIAIIDNQPVARWENNKKLIGNGAGGAMVGAVGMYALSSLKYVKTLFKSKPLVAAGIGAVIGLLSGVGIGALNNRASTTIRPENA